MLRKEAEAAERGGKEEDERVPSTPQAEGSGDSAADGAVPEAVLGAKKRAEIAAKLERIRKQMPDELGDLPAIQAALQQEGRVRRNGGDDTVFRHVYCDPLQGLSLGRLVRGQGDLPGRKPFAVTQRLTCKAPGHLMRHPDDSENNATTGGWIDHCPNKKLPRVPSLGAMGYSLRYVEYRYTAWLSFDVDTYLPVLNRPPLAEELYHHPREDNLHLPRTFRAELTNLAPEASLLLESTGSRAPASGGSDTRAHAHKLAASRRDLYGFLYHNASFEHLFHKRLGEQAVLLRELKSGRRVGSTRRKMMQRELVGITHKRVPYGPHPHWELYQQHYYS